MATTKKTAAPKKAGTAVKKSSPQKAAATPAATKKAATVSTAQPAKKTAASKAAATKDQADQAPAKKATAKKAPAKNVPAKKAPATKAPAAKTTPGQKAPATSSSDKKAPAKKAPEKKAPEKKTSDKVATGEIGGKTPVKDAAGAQTKVEQKPPSPPSSGTVKKTNGSVSRSGPEVFEIPAPRGTSKEGIAYTKDFDVKFLKAQWDMLLEERARLLGQAVRLEDEAHQLIEEAEMGDVQFDDEGGEGDTMVVERERDLALSAQARETITEIDAAIERIKVGTYGYSTTSGRPIQRERLEAIPWATELVSEKVGGIGRR